MSGTIVVGYIPSPEGVAAFERAKDEAVLRGATLVVVNTGEAGNYAKPSFAKAEDLEAIDKELTEAGLPHEVLQPTSGLAAAEEILRVAAERDTDLLVIGLRRRSPVGSSSWAAPPSRCSSTRPAPSWPSRRLPGATT